MIEKIIQSQKSFSKQPIWFLQIRTKKTAAEQRWKQRRNSDHLIKKRESEIIDNFGSKFVARSAYKLIALQKWKKILRKDDIIIDLGASPGGWTQVGLIENCKHIISIDKLFLNEKVIKQAEFNSLNRKSNSLTFIQGDILSNQIQLKVIEILKNLKSQENIINNDEILKVNVVMSDMMANTSGDSLRDAIASTDLISMATIFARKFLLPKNGILIAKYFQHTETKDCIKEFIQPHFEKIFHKRLSETHSASKEMYLICFGLKTESILEITARKEEKEE